MTSPISFNQAHYTKYKNTNSANRSFINKNDLSHDSVKFSSNSIAAQNINLNKLAPSYPVAKISFTGNPNKNKHQIALIGAENAEPWKIGGVATVMKDYQENVFTKNHKDKIKDDVRSFTPYYNGKAEFDENGNPTGKISVLTKNINGKETPICTTVDLDKTKIDDIPKNKYIELEEIVKTPMQWGENNNDSAALYKIKGTNNYMVYTDATAAMKKPYAESYYSSYSTAKNMPTPKSESGDAYAKFNKAVVELLPKAEDKEGFNPGHILCSDAQTAFVPEYIAQKVNSNSDYYKNAKASYIIHNAGAGYQGETSAKTMFYNFANKKQIDTVKNDPDYLNHIKNGNEDGYFKQFIPNLKDSNNNISATMIPLNYAEKGELSHIDTVSEEYAKEIQKNETMAPGINKKLNELSQKDMFGGILNGLSDPTLDPSKPISLPYYKEPQTFIKNGKEVTLEPLSTFHSNQPASEIREIKEQNKAKLLKRFTKGVPPKYAVGMDRPVNLIGHIDKQVIKNNPKLFVSWGRGDFQKGLDNVISAFEKVAETKNGKNSVLILGGELRQGDPEADIIKNKMNQALNNEKLKGRIVFMDGFAPNKPLAMASDATILASRFAPCELTPLEAPKYGSIVIDTNTGGMKQTNFDKNSKNPEEAKRATGYKTEHPYYMSHDELLSASDNYKKDFDSLVDQEKTKLVLRGAKDNDKRTVRSIAEQNILKSNEYNNVYRTHADAMLVNEYADKMNQYLNLPVEEQNQMMKNALNIHSSWSENNDLHPSKQSSQALYYEKHINKEAQAPHSRVFNFTKDVKENIIEDIPEKVKKASGKKAKLITATLALGTAALTGAMYYTKTGVFAPKKITPPTTTTK